MGPPGWALLPLGLLLLSQVHGDCPAPPNDLHAVLLNELKDSYPVGTVLRYTCIPGYQPISNPSIRCLSSSEWSAAPTFCEGRRCKVPTIENGKIESTGSLQLGEEITFVCDPGYIPLGKNTSRCTLYEDSKVEWDTEPPFCEQISCERPPVVVNASHSGDEFLDHYTVGTVVTYTCKKDLSLIGDRSIACITAEDGINGRWDKPAPKCKDVKCSRPQIPNGRLTSPFQPTYKYEHVLQFVCHAGYTLVGSEFVQCDADNAWHPHLPECLIKTTPSPGVTVSSGNSGTHNIFETDIESTQDPGGTVPKDESGNNHILGIVIGSLVLVVLIAAIFVFSKWRPCLDKNRKNDSHPTSKSYRTVPAKDVALEEK